MKKRIPVAVLGATGSVGQRFVQLLEDHPWFEVVAITGSDRKIQMTYEESCRWILAEPMPDPCREMEIQPSDPSQLHVKIAFSALPGPIAREIEPRFARAGVVVCSNASAFRQEPDVPILLPEINPDHTGLIDVQRRERGWEGFIVTNSNCTSTGISVVFNALHTAFGLRRAQVVSMQALSGAGYPGVPSLDIIDNVIPFIEGEEEKVESEPRKILGTLEGGRVQNAEFTISAQVNRVAVTNGHLVAASVELDKKVSPREAIRALTDYTAPEISRSLPSAPSPVIIVRAEPDRPQPRLDRLSGRGMATIVGRVRQDPIFDLKLVILSHNTIRGAAGGSIYNAELLVRKGLVE